ncbi:MULTISPECIES: S41 family peptidase [unclassified Tenacibaculum]|uniref:S41 family peptidase n=1 Tax=unclassified Tenacibaculum TaxID=2635139 RepID=UPI001F42DC44|nr:MULTISPECIES: S41 family peptidase [unclassified Tenacibaculum]MCF2873998.1 S41 family peptidase [Tenacibaculum sp. Cn5-1]MCF2934579.1 S41 family peptidase [Tenacibaculum sp. Cn5-34]MCG7510789.1 S41 family peptidase [Tenacibaculum sp. Cn5-46]
MKKILFSFLVIICCYSYAQQISNEDWTTDLNFLKTELAKKHKNLFFKISKQDFEKEIESIINSLEKDTNIETSIKLTQLIAKVGDTHTNLSISHLLRKRKTLPLGLIWFEDGLYINATSKDNYEILDKKLIAINNYKIETIIDSLKTLFVPENRAVINQNSKRLLSKHVLLKHFGFAKPNDSIYNLKLTDQSGKITNYKLKEVDIPTKRYRNKIYMRVNAQKPFYMNGSRKIFKEKYFPEEKIYFVQYNKCVSRETVEKYGKKEFAYRFPSFKKFETKVLKELNENKNIDKLIFDMRFNKGGSSYLAENLIKEIANNKKINQKGKLFVVVGNDTFSSAIFNTVDFKNNTNAIIIGEETGGKPNHYGNIKSFALPYSRIKVTFSSDFYKLSDKNENTITPDVLIRTQYDDFKKGIDPIFEYVKKQ